MIFNFLFLSSGFFDIFIRKIYFYSILLLYFSKFFNKNINSKMKDCSKFPNFKNYFKKNSSTLAAESVKATKLIYTKGQISELKKL